MTPATDNMTEGRTAFTAFKNAITKIVSVPHSVIVEREAAYKRQSNANPFKRGPKRQGTTDDGMEDIVQQMRAKRGR